MVRLIDIRKIAVSRSNVVDNLEEYERRFFNINLKPKKADESVASSSGDSEQRSRNVSSLGGSVVSGDMEETFEVDEDDDDQPIEALIRGKRGLSLDSESPLPATKRRSTAETVEINDSEEDEETETINTVEVKSEVIEEIPNQTSPPKTIPRVLTTINGQKVGGPIKILNQSALNGLKGPLRIVKPGQIIKGGQMIRPGRVLKPGQIIRPGQMINGKMIKVLGRPGTQNGQPLKIMNGQGLKIIRPPVNQFVQKPNSSSENGQKPVQMIQKPMKVMRALPNNSQILPPTKNLPKPVPVQSAPGKPIKFSGDFSKLTTVRLANGKLARVLTLPKDSQQAKAMTKIGKPIIHSSTISSPPKITTTPNSEIPVVQPQSPPESPSNSETCEVMVKDEPEDEVIMETDENTSANVSGVEPIERDDGFDFYCPEQEAPYTNSDGEDLDPFNLRGFPPKKRRTYVAKHECKICNKKFVRPAELQRHSRIHTGHKPYKCDICNHAFIRKDHLTSHMISHSETTYKCEQCNFRTARVDSFRRHVRRHEIDAVLPGGQYEDDEAFQEAEKEYQLQAMALPSMLSKAAFQPRSPSEIDAENNSYYVEEAEDTLVIDATAS